MRVDKFLKISRIIKRRTIANEACDAGRVSINGKVVKAGANVKVGDILEIKFGNNTTKIQVLSLNESVKKEDASSMYFASAEYMFPKAKITAAAKIIKNFFILFFLY